MFGLLTALIGVALATLGVFIFIGNRYRGRAGHNGMGSEVLSISLLLGGGAILFPSLGLDPFTNGQPDTNDRDALAEGTAPAAAMSRSQSDSQTPATNASPYVSAQILSWGTPSDTDEADEQSIFAYSEKLQQLAAGLLKKHGLASNIRAHTLNRDEYQELQSLPPALANWCGKGADQQLLLVIGMEAKILDNREYALWREPVYTLLDCSTEQMTRRIGKVNEKRGDLFPYQLAVRADIASLLDDFNSQR